MTHASCFSAVPVAFCTLLMVSAAALAHSPSTTFDMRPPDLVLEVAIDGADENDGVHRPVATLAKALSLADKARADAVEIVIHGGTYKIAQPITISPLNDQSERSLVIRAAAGEQPVFDGGQAVSAVAMPDEPGVYHIGGSFQGIDLPQVWDEGQQIRYRGVSGMEALRGTDFGVFRDTPASLAIHPKGGVLPPSVELQVATPEYGLEITRNHVTVDGLSFTGFGRSHTSAGIGVGFAAETQGMTDDVSINNCRVENSYSGFFIRRGSRHVAIRSCVMRNVASGVNQWGGVAVIEGCDIRNDDFGTGTFAFKNSDQMTGGTGIRAYYNSTGGYYRNNTIKGFQYAIFIKTVTPEATSPDSGTFIIEDNTLIDDAELRANFHGENSWGVGFVRYWLYGKDKAVVRRNVIDGFTIPLPKDSNASTSPGADQATVDENLIWYARQPGAMDSYTRFFREQGLGANNLAADPRFANRKGGDYRLLPGSPMVIAGWRKGEDRRQVLQPGEHYLPSVKVEVPQISRKQGYVKGGYVLASTTDVAVKLSAYGWGVLKKTRIKIFSQDREISSDMHEFKSDDVISLPEEKGAYVVDVAVMDENGVWSEGQILRVQRGIPSFDFNNLMTLTNRYGFVVFNPDNQGYDQFIRYRRMGEKDWMMGFDTLLTYGSASDYRLRKLGAQPLVVTGLEPGTTYEYQIVIKSSATGQTSEYTASPVQTATTIGESRVYYVSPEGIDAWGRGSRSEPLKSLQSALDLSLPGDTIRLLPGVYHGAAVMVHSGTYEYPITIEAEQPDTAIITVDKDLSAVLTLTGAAHVRVRALNIQWAQNAGIVCERCDSVEIAGNHLLNTLLGGHDQAGQGIKIVASKNARIHHNVIHGWWTGMGFYRSQGTIIENNTILDTAQTGITVGDDSKGSRITYNSINYSGNHALEFTVQDLDYSDYMIDYNNYGTSFQPPARSHADADTILPRAYAYLRDSREFIYSYTPLPNLAKQVVYSVAEWKAGSGYDAHSIFVDPLWVDPPSFRFDVNPASKNLLPDGRYIGAAGCIESCR